MKIKVKAGTFNLGNSSKLRRVIESTTGSSGNMIKGLGKDADHKVIIAAYDRIAGHITGKESATVKTGCFYDFENKKAFETPKVVYEFRVGKKTVYVDADKDVPMEVKAVHTTKMEETKELKKKATKGKTKK